MTKIPINRQDDGELLGFIEKSSAGWTAQTIFGYVFARAVDEHSVEETVRSQGLNVLQGVWQYFDKKEKAWHPCILKEVFENKVIVIRTNEMGFQDPDTYKRVIIINPTETNLVKS
ncbi:MAG: hypothetical protein JWO07_257 [Candidatus Saccharibacteria bacterium]|nr:hypothetical protein [Candidatus Saccharibacteria bacterium]